MVEYLDSDCNYIYNCDTGNIETRRYDYSINYEDNDTHYTERWDRYTCTIF